jgi:hypothetical protein
MSPRSRALVALVASVALLVGSGIAWAVSRNAGLGSDLEQVTTARTAAELNVSRGPARPATANTAGQEESSGATSPWVTEETTRIDATEIVIAAPVVPPNQMVISDVGVDMSVIATGVADDGQMELPDDTSVLGWYKFGARPGDDQGSAVLAGHVDSFEYGVGPLASLPAVQPGAEISIADADGTLLRYQVVSVQRYDKVALPVDEIFRPDGPHQLAVVTCGGRYIGGAVGYEDNIVVLAEPVAE